MFYRTKTEAMIERALETSTYGLCPFGGGGHLVIIGFSTKLDRSSFEEEEGTTKEM